jgi:hypothetical protein
MGSATTSGQTVSGQMLGVLVHTGLAGALWVFNILPLAENMRRKHLWALACTCGGLLLLIFSICLFW